MFGDVEEVYVCVVFVFVGMSFDDVICGFGCCCLVVVEIVEMVVWMMIL